LRLGVASWACSGSQKGPEQFGFVMRPLPNADLTFFLSNESPGESMPANDWYALPLFSIPTFIMLQQDKLAVQTYHSPQSNVQGRNMMMCSKNKVSVCRNPGQVRPARVLRVPTYRIMAQSEEDMREGQSRIQPLKYLTSLNEGKPVGSHLGRWTGYSAALFNPSCGLLKSIARSMASGHMKGLPSRLVHAEYVSGRDRFITSQVFSRLGAHKIRFLALGAGRLHMHSSAGRVGLYYEHDVLSIRLFVCTANAKGISSGLIITDLLLKNDGVNTSFEQRKHRRRLSLQASQRIEDFCAWTLEDEVQQDAPSLWPLRERNKLTSPRFPANRTYSSSTSCSSGDRDSSPVAPGLLSSPDIECLWCVGSRWSFRYWLRRVIVVLWCFGEEIKDHSECFGLVNAKTGTILTGCSPIPWP
ncbi:hypothetical protein KCU87_g288, partial [Aureobasidium melanogenum]